LDIGVYEAPTLQRKIEAYIRDLSNRNQSPAPISFHTLEDYLESNPDDELFEHELHPPINPSEWWISHYWTPGGGSNGFEPVQALGELPQPTEIITEEEMMSGKGGACGVWAGKDLDVEAEAGDL
jgi:hypothetical protein